MAKPTISELNIQDLIIPDFCGSFERIGAVSTGRSGGVSRAPFDDGSGSEGGGLNLGLHSGDCPVSVQENRLRVQAYLPSLPVWLDQMHGANVVDAATIRPGDIVAADASFTTVPGIVCVVMAADCLPVLFSDARGKVVAAAHAGWRGLAAGVLKNTVQAMRAAGADELHAWLGPAIGPSRFEVGAEVRDAFINLGFNLEVGFTQAPGRATKYFANLHNIARELLRTIGVNAITSVPLCTATSSRRFYSYRRDQQTGRMASFIWIR